MIRVDRSRMPAPPQLTSHWAAERAVASQFYSVPVYERRQSQFAFDSPGLGMSGRP
ncbi:hypothetical protein [Actinoplanes sp. CA-252034]|uniref:hypothetical protein n=1 Tax=Actinoplanes sp. CA-252034 TaxID=3239906 RepID=UPI003D97001F